MNKRRISVASIDGRQYRVWSQRRDFAKEDGLKWMSQRPCPRNYAIVTEDQGQKHRDEFARDASDMVEYLLIPWNLVK